eukprot:Clim_evm22s70 gene=Clim_evmTU22s70
MARDRFHVQLHTASYLLTNDQIMDQIVVEEAMEAASDGTSSGAHITDLPDEVFYLIREHLDAVSWQEIGYTCKRLRKLCHDEKFWEKMCKDDLLIDPLHDDMETWEHSVLGAHTLGYENMSTLQPHMWRLIYNLCEPYRQLQGLWAGKFRRHRTHPYGAMFYIHFSNGKLHLRYMTGYLEFDKQEVNYWARVSNGNVPSGEDRCPTPCIQLRLSPHKLAFDNAYCDYQSKLYLPRRINRLQSMLRERMDDAYADGVQTKELETTLEIMEPGLAYLSIQHFDLDLSRLPSGCYMDPDFSSVEGVWVGDYGPHGVEIIAVTLEDGVLYGRKITGDENVPANELTWRVQIQEQPEEVDYRMWNVRFAQDHMDGVDSVRLIYPGAGQIAGHGFRDPTYVPGKFAVVKDTSEHRFIEFVWTDAVIGFGIRYKRFEFTDRERIGCQSFQRPEEMPRAPRDSPQTFRGLELLLGNFADTMEEEEDSDSGSFHANGD